jgi:hypothetical protein
MTYTCTRDFSTQGRDFTTGDKINATEYIALTAEERGNFEPSHKFKPLSERKMKDWDKHYFNW